MRSATSSPPSPSTSPAPGPPADRRAIVSLSTTSPRTSKAPEPPGSRGSSIGMSRRSGATWRTSASRFPPLRDRPRRGNGRGVVPRPSRSRSARFRQRTVSFSPSLKVTVGYSWGENETGTAALEVADLMVNVSPSGAVPVEGDGSVTWGVTTAACAVAVAVEGRGGGADGRGGRDGRLGGELDRRGAGHVDGDRMDRVGHDGVMGRRGHDSGVQGVEAREPGGASISGHDSIPRSRRGPAWKSRIRPDLPGIGPHVRQARCIRHASGAKSADVAIPTPLRRPKPACVSPRIAANWRARRRRRPSTHRDLTSADPGEHSLWSPSPDPRAPRSRGGLNGIRPIRPPRPDNSPNSPPKDLTRRIGPVMIDCMHGVKRPSPSTTRPTRPEEVRPPGVATAGDDRVRPV